jgi:hypothetical protein
MKKLTTTWFPVEMEALRQRRAWRQRRWWRSDSKERHEVPFFAAWAMPRRRRARPSARHRARPPHLPGERQELGLNGAGEAGRARRGVGCVQRRSLITPPLLDPESRPMTPQATRRRWPNPRPEPSRLAPRAEPPRPPAALPHPPPGA